MADLRALMRSRCLKPVLPAFFFSLAISLHVLACALYNNWWPMLTVIMYVLLPMPLLCPGSGSSLLLHEPDNSWINRTKFLTGFSAVGSIAIPLILEHAGVICGDARVMEFFSFVTFVEAIISHILLKEEWIMRISSQR